MSTSRDAWKQTKAKMLLNYEIRAENKNLLEKL